MSVDKNGEKRIGNGDDGLLYLLQVKLIVEGSVLQRIDVLPAAT